MKIYDRIIDERDYTSTLALLTLKILFNVSMFDCTEFRFIECPKRNYVLISIEGFSSPASPPLENSCNYLHWPFIWISPRLEFVSVWLEIDIY